MCGFIGQFNTPNLSPQKFKKLLGLSIHRGPDQTGFWSGNNVQLGFNRLAVLELSEAGNQPMVSPSGKYVLVYNGEVYNHLEIRNKLPAHNYRGQSDTESICHALDVWGVRKTIENLDGMFALAIYDKSNQTLTLIRDFAGIKPLFYGFEKGQVVFASQYDQVKTHPLFQDKAVNPQVLKLFLKQHFLPAPFGLHNNIHQLRPGELITFSLEGKFKKERYWEIQEKAPTELIDDEREAISCFIDSFDSGIASQLIADVPLGAFLSGGIDSPLVCSLAKKHKPNIEVFSIGSDSTKHDESEKASEFARALSLIQHLWMLDGKEMQKEWFSALSSLHEPIADLSVLPTYLVSKLAKNNVTVALSGDGGDELFFGYERFWSVAHNLSFQHWSQPVRKRLYQIDKALCKNRHVNSLITLKNQGSAHESLHSRFNDKWLYRISPDLQEINLPEDWNTYDYEDTKDLRTLMMRMRKAEFYGMLQKTLRKVDLTSMQNSLEVRVPFLQKKTIEAALSIDPLINIKNRGRKRLLEKQLRNMIPEMQPETKKKGFSIPLGKWISKDLHSVFKDSLHDLVSKYPFFNELEVRRMLDSHTQGTEDLKWPLFTLYALQCQN